MLRNSRSLDLNLPQNLLAGKTNPELTKLSEDKSKLVEFFSTLTLQDLENAKKKKAELADENKLLAGNTYSLKSRFESLKAILTDRSLEAAVLKADYEKRLAELKALSQNDHASILKALQEVKKTEEQHSEDLVDGFLSGKQSGSVEEFVQQYLTSRKLYWLRKTKADKLEEQLKAMPPKPVPRPSKLCSSILPSVSKSKSVLQDQPSVSNPQGQPQPPYQPTASLPPAFQPPSNPPLPTQSLQYSRPPPQPYAHPGYPPPPQHRPYGPPPGAYPPPAGYYPPAPYQSIGNQPPPRPQSQPYPYPVYRPPYH